jgi:hypothetical protein
MFPNLKICVALHPVISSDRAPPRSSSVILAHRHSRLPSCPRLTVIPAQAGIHDDRVSVNCWVPACTRMTLRKRLPLTEYKQASWHAHRRLKNRIALQLLKVNSKTKEPARRTETKNAIIPCSEGCQQEKGSASFSHFLSCHSDFQPPIMQQHFANL